MTSVIIGDIIHSQKASPRLWLEKLKSELNTIGINPKTWEVFRGDSFEVEIKDPPLSLYTALRIKASIKCIKNIDVRMAIGIGEKTYDAHKITESNGPVFVRSAEVFETLVRKQQNLAIATPSKILDKEMNLLLRFALILMDNWTANSAEMVHLALTHPGLSQKDMGKILGIKQNAVSNRLKRACFDQVTDLLVHYHDKIKEIYK